MLRDLALTSLAALLVAGAASAQSAAPSSSGYRVVSELPLPDGGWDLMSFDPVLRRLYVARTDSVAVLDAQTGKLNAKLGSASRGHGVVPLKGGTEVMVTNGATDTAAFLDSRTGAELASVKVGADPDAAVFDPATGLAAVMNAKAGSISLIDPASHTLVGEIAVGGGLEIAAVDGTGTLYVNVEDRNDLAVVDLKAKRLVKRIALTGCDGPTGLAWLPVSRRLLSSCANGVAAVTDPATGKVSTLPIGKGPDTAAYDARRHLALVPAGRSGELDLFADTPEGVRPAGKAATHLGARTGAVDEQTGRFYCVAADYEPTAAGERRPKMKPGSVRIVVVAPVG